MLHKTKQEQTNKCFKTQWLRIVSNYFSPLISELVATQMSQAEFLISRLWALVRWLPVGLSSDSGLLHFSQSLRQTVTHFSYGKQQEQKDDRQKYVKPHVGDTQNWLTVTSPHFLLVRAGHIAKPNICRVGKYTLLILVGGTTKSSGKDADHNSKTRKNYDQ